jgi:soluble lytic murein transglycosylase
MIKKSFWIIILVLIVLLNCSPQKTIRKPADNTQKPLMREELIKNTHNSLSDANTYYNQKKYAQAVQRYLDVYNKSPHVINNADNFFKIGFCYFSENKPDSAILWFEKVFQHHSFQFEDYTAFFMGESYKKTGNEEKAEHFYQQCAQNTRNAYLANKARWEIVTLLKGQNSDSIFSALNKIKFSKLLNQKEDYILLKVKLLKEFEDNNELISFCRKLLKSDWHSHVQDTLVSVLVTHFDEIETKAKINILKLLMNKHKDEYFDNWYLMLTRDSSLSRKEQAQIDFHKAVKLYKERKWQSSSQMLNKINSRDLPNELRGDYALYIARCHNRKGFQNNAIRAYYNFQKKYPRHRLAGDALWWIALTFEQRNDYKSAKKYYNILAKKYFSKNVGKEAALRLIFNDIKAKKYTFALKQISKIMKKLDYDDKMRMTWWQMYCLNKLGKFSEAEERKHVLLKDPFQNFYTIKTFLSTYADSLNIYRDYAPYEAPSHYNLEDDLRGKIDRIFYIQELMGENFARLEIKSSLSNHHNNKNYRLILAELNDKLGNYDEAFRINRRNYEKYFIRKQWHEKIGFIKNLYPLYYDETVYPLAHERNVDPLLIYALMKRESLFQARVKSYANAYGLMQILPSTAKNLSRRLNYHGYREPLDLYEPAVNVNLGIFYLQNLLKQFDGSLPQVLASYNAGESRVERWEKRYLQDDEIEIFMELIPIDQTRKYVKYILYYYYNYQWFYRLEEGICWYKPLEYTHPKQ